MKPAFGHPIPAFLLCLIRLCSAAESDHRVDAVVSSGNVLSEFVTAQWQRRVQTPDEEGNITVAFRDLLLGGQSKDARLKQHRIEPGIRECYAMIVMTVGFPVSR